MSVSLCVPTERVSLSADPVHQINTFRSFLNVLGDPQVILIPIGCEVACKQYFFRPLVFMYGRGVGTMSEFGAERVS